jgi:hypothetical protein
MGNFFATEAEVMRRILVNRARDKGRTKRGDKLQRLDIDKPYVVFHAWITIDIGCASGNKIRIATPCTREVDCNRLFPNPWRIAK